MPHARSILLVAQLTPPSPLVGAHRPGALAKHLARRGHRVTVLTSTAAGSGAVPGAERVIRTRDLLSSRLNWRRGHLDSLQGRRQATYGAASPLERIVVPDLSLIGWVPFVLPRALGLLASEGFDCVITTSPPPSVHLVGAALRARGVPWIADLRDGWTFDPPRAAWPTGVQDTLERVLERRVLGAASRIVAVTGPIADDAHERLGRPVAVLTNGFDPDDGPAGTAPPLDTDRHSLVHTGRLTVVGRSPHAFFDGLHEYLRRRPDGARQLEVVLAGPISAEQERLMADPRLAGLVRSVGSLERGEALALQRRADTLLVLAEGDAVRPARSVATGKLFEYLATGRPILVLGADSEAARIVTGAGAGIAGPGDNPVAIAQVLERVVDHGAGNGRADVGRYSWPVLAEGWESEIAAAIARP